MKGLNKGLNKDLKYVGKTFPIHDAPQRVRGETVFVSDLKLTNMVYAKLLLSPIAHALFRKMEADTEYGPYDFGSYGSRVTYICGACAYEVAKRVKAKLLECAADI